MSNLATLVQPDPEDLEEMDKPLGLDVLKSAVPKGRRHNITQDLTDTINGVITDPEVRDSFRNNIIGFTDVLTDPKITITAYVQAVRFVSYKLTGHTDFDSYVKTFPERYERMLDDGKTMEHIRAIVSQYNSGKTVMRILEQTLMPTHVLNYDIYQQAVNTQAQIMMNPLVSDKVRSDAANSLMIALKQPETAKLKIDVTVKDDDSIRQLKEVSLELAMQQRELIKAGATDARIVAESKLVSTTHERIE